MWSVAAKSQKYLADICQPAEVRHLFESHLNGTQDLYLKLNLLLSLTIWLEQAEQLNPTTVDLQPHLS
jgi:hypothetical protein